MPETTTKPAAEGRIVVEGLPPTRAFAVISWGATATKWLAWALNSHPDIYCVHQANQFWYSMGGAPLLDGADYLRLIVSQGDGYLAAGDVHGVSRETVPAIRQMFGERFRSAVLIRDPQARLRSQFAVFERYKQHRSYEIDYVNDIIDRRGLPISKDDYERKLYVHGIDMLNRITEEVAVGPIFTAESITSNPDALASIVRAVAGDDIEISSEWCERTVASPRLNSHNDGKSDPLTEPWIRELIAKVVQPEAWELYRQYGYEPPAFL